VRSQLFNVVEMELAEMELAEWVAGLVAKWTRVIIMPLCGPYCKLTIARLSARLHNFDAAVDVGPYVI
jgi:hypothetical protein